MNKINYIFWGTPDVASETLEILKRAQLLPSLIITSPDAKSGRGMQLKASPVATFAEENNIPCLKPEKFDSDFTSQLEANTYNLFIVVAYGKILAEEIIKIPKFGSINIHYSLLPKYRGASPVESAILNGEQETGVTIQKMVYQMDAGAIIAQEKTHVEATELAPELRKRLIKMGGELLVKIMPEIMAGNVTETPQDESQATFCKKIKKEDGLIDLNDDTKENHLKNYNKFRAYAHWPRTFFFREGKRIIITKAKLDNEKFIIEKIIPEGGKEIEYRPSISK